MTKAISTLHAKQFSKVFPKRSMKCIEGIDRVVAELNKWPEIDRIVIRHIDSRRRSSRSKYKLSAKQWSQDKQGSRDGVLCQSCSGGLYQNLMLFSADPDALNRKLHDHPEFESTIN